MSRPCGNCCSPDPGDECSTQGALPHPSAGREYVMTTTGTLNTATLQKQCVATLTLTDAANAIGRRHLLDMEVTATTDDRWTALQVVWFDAPLNLNTKAIGSINTIVGGFTFKASSINPLVKPNDDAGPWFVKGIALRQNGQTFYALFEHDLYSFGSSCCWQTMASGPTDQPCLSSGPGSLVQLGLHRPMPDNITSDTETVLSGRQRLCADWFGTLNADGTIDFSNRPNLDLHHEDNIVDQIGYVWGISSVPPFVAEDQWGARGAWQLSGITGPVCGVLTTSAFPYTAGADDAPQPPGTLEVDEDFSNGLPSGWTSSETTALPGVYLDDDIRFPSFGGPGQIFTGRDSMLVAEDSSRTDNEYTSGIAYIDLAIPSGPQSESFTVTIEALWRRINEQDRRYVTADGWHPLDIRSQECGIFAAPFGKLILAHRIAQLDVGAPLTQSASVQLTYPTTELGAPATGEYWLYPRTAFGWRCPCELNPPGIECMNPGVGTNSTNPSLGRAAQCGGTSPEDGTRMTMQIKRLPARLSSDCNFDLTHEFAKRFYSIDAWINGRPVVGYGSLFNAPMIWSETTLRVGVIAHWGGAWSNFRAWVQR